MNAPELFNHWRKIKRPDRSWGLAWFFAYEFCKRYYSSHGIVPWVIEHEGLGYYGITLNQLPCSVNRNVDEPYGRMTIGGDVENWQRGSPGDHGLSAIELCFKNVPVEEIVHKAISHMGIDPIPAISHLHCRHKRWGASYELCFEVATILALKYEQEELEIWNHPFHTKRAISELDSKSGMKEHLGAFLFIRNGKKLLLAADGRLLDGSNKNLWHNYMNGFGVSELAELIEIQLGA